MALFGNKSHLMQRISRIIEKRKSRINISGKILLLLLVSTTATLAVVSSRFGGLGTHVVTIREETPTHYTEIEAIDTHEEGITDTEPEMPVDIVEPVIPEEYAAPPEEIAPYAIVAAYKEDCRALPVNDRVDTVKNDFSAQDANDMVNELRTDGIISNNVNTYYQIDDHQMIVNDVRQPEVIRQKYFRKYLKFSGRSVCYRNTSKE
jgi:hypothetical protein